MTTIRAGSLVSVSKRHGVYFFWRDMGSSQVRVMTQDDPIASAWLRPERDILCYLPVDVNVLRIRNLCFLPELPNDIRSFITFRAEIVKLEMIVPPSPFDEDVPETWATHGLGIVYGIGTIPPDTRIYTWGTTVFKVIDEAPEPISVPDLEMDRSREQIRLFLLLKSALGVASGGSKRLRAW